MTKVKIVIVMKDPATLRPHPLNKQLYGNPTDNSEYKQIRADMKERGYDERWPLLLTPDDRILWGATRNAAARSLGLPEVPCMIFTPSSPETAELEYEKELIRGNVQRQKTGVMVARELRKLLEVEKELARVRMGHAGLDGGPSKSADRVAAGYTLDGKTLSGKSVDRRVKVLDKIEECQAKGDHRKAERLTELLNGGKIVQALTLIKGKKAAAKKPPAVDVPRSPLDHSEAARSENYEACAKARTAGEVEIVEANIGEMQQHANTARTRLGMPAPQAAPAPARPAPAVWVDSGIDPLICLKFVPRERWAELVDARQGFIFVEMARAVRKLVEWVGDADAMWEALGYASAEDLIAKGYGLKPQHITLAASWLRLESDRQDAAETAPGEGKGTPGRKRTRKAEPADPE
jgi:hypothetical protein